MLFSVTESVSCLYSVYLKYSFYARTNNVKMFREWNSTGAGQNARNEDRDEEQCEETVEKGKQVRARTRPSVQNKCNFRLDTRNRPVVSPLEFEARRRSKFRLRHRDAVVQRDPIRPLRRL